MVCMDSLYGLTHTCKEISLGAISIGSIDLALPVFFLKLRASSLLFVFFLFFEKVFRKENIQISSRSTFFRFLILPMERRLSAHLLVASILGFGCHRGYFFTNSLTPSDFLNAQNWVFPRKLWVFQQKGPYCFHKLSID